MVFPRLNPGFISRDHHGYSRHVFKVAWPSGVSGPAGLRAPLTHPCVSMVRPQPARSQHTGKAAGQPRVPSNSRPEPTNICWDLLTCRNPFTSPISRVQASDACCGAPGLWRERGLGCFLVFPDTAANGAGITHRRPHLHLGKPTRLSACYMSD